MESKKRTVYLTFPRKVKALNTLISSPDHTWQTRFNISTALNSRFGLLRILRYLVFLYLCFSALTVLLSTPVHILLSATLVRDAISSVLLLGLLCLHLTSALQRDAYTLVDTVLDASAIAIASLTMQSPILANTTFYLALIVAACLVQIKSILRTLGVFVLANFLSTLGMHYLFLSTTGNVHFLDVLVWQFFCANVILFPAVSVLLCGLTQVLKVREKEIAVESMARKQLAASQTRLLIAEKMAALGRMSGSIAHEINNQLSAIVAAFDLLHGQIERMMHETQENASGAHMADTYASFTRWIGSGQAAAERSIDFVRKITLQTKQLGSTKQSQFDPSSVIEDLAQLLVPSCTKAGCQLHVLLNDTSLSLVGDPGEFTQIILNLVHNAIDAYQDKEDGEKHPIWVTLSRSHEKVVLEVSDAGCGISEENRAKIFDYLFTTKKDYHGSGMGLSIVHEIVTGHFGGIIDVHSHEGKGTTFILTFPSQSTDISRELAII